MQQIGDTPLSISVYSVEEAPTKINEEGVLEILFCLKGSFKFSYAYEEFRLNRGEFISVDKDAYFLHEGKNNLVVSFYLDLKRYQDKYPSILNNLFVCEALAETTGKFPTKEHKRLKGMLIALLKVITENGAPGKVEKAVDGIVDLFVKYFDIFFFHTGEEAGKSADKKLDRLKEINAYVRSRMKEGISLKELAEKMNLTESYMSEFMRKNSVGFRAMISYVRANYSERLLLYTDKTILEISEECGFSDVKYYYSAFKRWYRCTPNQFRKQYGSRVEERIEYYDMKATEEIVNRLMEEYFIESYL